MSEIAHRVGVRKASLYNYYPSKADLLIELLEQNMEAWEQACRPALEQDGSTEKRLGDVLLAAMAFADAEPQAIGIVRLAATQVSGELRDRVEDLMAHHEDSSGKLLDQFFASAIEKGDLDQADPHELTLFWKSFIHGLLLTQIFPSAKSSTFRTELPSVWALFWRGLSGRLPEQELGS